MGSGTITSTFKFGIPLSQSLKAIVINHVLYYNN